jgi:hypothetical protein
MTENIIPQDHQTYINLIPTEVVKLAAFPGQLRA